MALRSKVEQDEVVVARFRGRTSVCLVQGLSPSQHSSSSPRPRPSAAPSSALPRSQADPLGLSLPPSMHQPLHIYVFRHITPHPEAFIAKRYIWLTSTIIGHKINPILYDE
ncbi:hypothetical protein DVH24_017106 [Malus domestica]|uniref:Uncharacterized protein n=1 Tax=Malus domestica TaxID=3750 RepID=A0A498IX64_MALDO|nr:hypothetical protein DVH24_017106 [Malus domestica]